MRSLRVLGIAFVLYLVVGFTGLPGQASTHASPSRAGTEQSYHWLSHPSARQVPTEPATSVEKKAPPTTQIVYSQATVTSKNVGAFSADCPKDTHVVGGGYFLDTKATNVYVLASTPFQKDGIDYWGVEVNNDTSSSIPLLISAVCAS